MQYKSIFIVLILGWISALVGCSKGGAVCDTGLSPKISSNAPVGTNQSLKLTSFGVSGAKSWSWTGPNGFTSTEKEPVITAPPRGKGNIYYVTVTTDGGCTYTGTSDSITVTGPTNTCSLDTNNARLIGVVTMSFSKMVGVTGTSDYSITCSSATASVTVEFPNNQPPAEGIYTVTSSTSALGAGYCRLTAKAITTAPWTTTSGSVYVSVDNNVTTISFCEINFSSTDYGADPVKGGAHIVWTP